MSFFFLRNRLLSDISRLEAKVERLESQLQAKDREIATITRTVRSSDLCEVLTAATRGFVDDSRFHDQEAKATAQFKAQIEKLQQERDEFQRMVIGNQVKIVEFYHCVLVLAA